MCATIATHGYTHTLWPSLPPPKVRHVDVLFPHNSQLQRESLVQSILSTSTCRLPAKPLLLTNETAIARLTIPWLALHPWPALAQRADRPKPPLVNFALMPWYCFSPAQHLWPVSQLARCADHPKFLSATPASRAIFALIDHSMVEHLDDEVPHQCHINNMAMNAHRWPFSSPILVLYRKCSVTCQGGWHILPARSSCGVAAARPELRLLEPVQQAPQPRFPQSHPCLRRPIPSCHCAHSQGNGQQLACSSGKPSRSPYPALQSLPKDCQHFLAQANGR